MNLTDEPLATVDMGDFETNIDRAIDELFVHKSGVAAPLPEEEAPAVAAPGKAQPPPPKAAYDLLQGLKESLLSLDWEISADNIQKFERELDGLKEKLGEDRHSLAVIKMALGVCKYLRAMKYSASAVSVQFLHSATRTLDLLQRKPQLSAAERRDLMDKMLTKFRRLKAEVQRIKAVKAGGPKEAPAEFAAEPAMEPLAVEEPKPVVEQAEELVLEPLPEAEEAEPELLLVAEKDEPRLQAPEEELALPAEQEEEPILTLKPEKPTARYREDTLEIEPEDEERGAPEAREEEKPLARLEEVPSEPAPDVSADWRLRLDEARSHSMELAQSLTELGQETDKFFSRLLQAVAGKAALQRVADYFGKIHLDQAEKLAGAQQSATRLGDMLEALGQTPWAGESAEPLPEGYGVLSAQLREIQESLRRLSESVGRLEEGSLSPPAIAGGDELTHEMQEPVTLDAPLESVTALEPSELLAPEIPEPSEASDSQALDDLPLMDEALEPEEPAPSAAAAEVSTASPAVSQIFLTNVAGTTIGIPIEAVSQVFKISKGKAKALRKRGYATLVDFKAPFRSINRGLSGPLAEQPVKELKKARFPLVNLSPEVVGTDAANVAQAPVKGIVILSDGQRHGSLLTEDLLEKRPYQVLGFRQAGLPGDVLGTATIEGDFEINVLNLNHLLS